MAEKTKFETVDDYLKTISGQQRTRLEQIIALVWRTVPDAREVISYNMPAFQFNGILIYLAAHRNHIGFYPASSSAIDHFKKELGHYLTSKGTVQIQNAEELPIRLLEKMIRFRAEENLAKALLKKKRR